MCFRAGGEMSDNARNSSLNEGHRQVAKRNAAYWLNKAEKARTRAAGMHNPDAIATMLDIAAKYEEMAQQAERREIRATAKATKPKSSNQ